MLLSATLYPDNRVAGRLPVKRDATLRDKDARPVDIMIENLSTAGFGMSASVDMPLGSIMGLRLPGIAKRDIRIIRRLGLTYGCEFANPLTERELVRALTVADPASTSIHLGKADVLGGDNPRNAPRKAKVSVLTRLGILAVLTVTSWAVIIIGIELMI